MGEVTEETGLSDAHPVHAFGKWQPVRVKFQSGDELKEGKPVVRKIRHCKVCGWIENSYDAE